MHSWEGRFALISLTKHSHDLSLVQLQPREMLIYVNLDVHVWLQIHKQCGRPDLTRVGNYVLEIDVILRNSEILNFTLIKTALLVQFM